MLLSEAYDIYELIYNATKHTNMHRSGIDARAQVFDMIEPICKVAFDTRRINQENTYNPRRNLQYYHRSEPFIDGDMSIKIAYFMKMKSAVDMIKERYSKEPEWFDSYARLLSSALDRALRTEQKDADFFKAQFNYLDELLYVRYRLANEDIQKMSELDIERIVLSRDEKLLHKQIYGAQQNQSIIKTNQPDPLIDKLLSGVKASSDNADVERTVSITVRDKINEFSKHGNRQ